MERHTIPLNRLLKYLFSLHSRNVNNKTESQGAQRISEIIPFSSGTSTAYKSDLLSTEGSAWLGFFMSSQIKGITQGITPSQTLQVTSPRRNVTSPPSFMTVIPGSETLDVHAGLLNP